MQALWTDGRMTTLVFPQIRQIHKDGHVHAFKAQGAMDDEPLDDTQGYSSGAVDNGDVPQASPDTGDGTPDGSASTL